MFPSRKSSVARLTCIFTRFPRFTASFSVDTRAILRVLFFRAALDSHEVISAVASSRLLCALSHADLTGALQNYGVFPEGIWYHVESTPHPPSHPFHLCMDVNCRFSTLFSFFFPRRNVRVTMAARTRALSAYQSGKMRV